MKNIKKLVSVLFSAILLFSASTTNSIAMDKIHFVIGGGAVGGLIVVYGTKLLFSLKIDDVVGAIPAHLFAGIWGTLIVPATNSGANFSTQLIGVLSVNIFVFIVAYIVFSAIKATIGLRLSKEGETKGTDVTETGVIAYAIRD